MKKFFRALMSLLLCVLLVAAAGGLYYWYNLQKNQTFITTFYQMKTDKNISGLRIVLLSDLHLKEYGENNADLVKKIEKLSPSLIAIVGDMTIETVDSHERVINLLQQLVPIAPVYYSSGNHEYSDILHNEKSTLIRDIRATGAIYLDNKYQKAEIGGNTLQIGGICLSADNVLRYKVPREMLQKFTQEEDFTLLLSHYPEVFISQLEGYPVDLGLSGHAHGGQVRLPLVGDGLYSPDQGFLPKYTSGLRQMSGSTVVISRGLGDSHTGFPPRINNQPELVVVDVN